MYPGMMFSLAKDRMESSKLWRIVKKMPKGTLLHCHLGAMVDARWIIDEALHTEGICITADDCRCEWLGGSDFQDDLSAANEGLEVAAGRKVPRRTRMIVS